MSRISPRSFGLFAVLAGSAYAATITPVAPVQDATDKCYLISSAEELYGYAAMINGDGVTQKSYACGKLTKDIVVNENVLKADGTLDSSSAENFVEWKPLASTSGNFDGQGFSISGLYINNPTQEYVGFIGKIKGQPYGPAVEIKNLTIKDSFFAGKNYVSAVATYVEKLGSVKMDSVHVQATVLGRYYVSGLIGGSSGITTEIYNSSNDGIVGLGPDSSAYNCNIGGLVGGALGTTTTISNSSNHASVHGRYGVGGFIGNSTGTISVSESFNTGSVSGIGNQGGLVGGSNGTLDIFKSYNLGDVSGGEDVGGLTGHADGTATIVRSYNEGNVTGTTYVGGISPRTYRAAFIANCYNLGTVSGNNYVAGILGYEDRTGTYFDVTMYNNYNMGDVVSTKNFDPLMNVYKAGTEPLEKVENNFFLLSETLTESPYGKGMEKSAFVDTVVVNELYDFVQKDGDGAPLDGGVTGAMWYQDSIPLLNDAEIYKLVFSLNGGSLENPPSAYTKGVEFDLPIPVRTGYEFKGWFTSAALGTSESAVTKIEESDAGHKMFFAAWKIMVYKVNVSVNDSAMGKVVGLENDGDYKYNDILHITAEPAEGFYFVDWTSDAGEFKDAHITPYVTSDMNLVANFAKIPESSSSSEDISSSSVESSSSSVDSSSSDQSDAFVAVKDLPRFGLMAVERNIQVVGAPAGSSYAVMDLQGRILSMGRVQSARFEINLSRAGTYMVRIGNQVQTIKLK